MEPLGRLIVESIRPLWQVDNHTVNCSRTTSIVSFLRCGSDIVVDADAAVFLTDGVEPLLDLSELMEKYPLSHRVRLP